MYKERHPIQFSEGLHASPVEQLAYLGLGNHGLRIDDVPFPNHMGEHRFDNEENFTHFCDNFKNPQQEIEISAHNGDPQAERDLVHIAKYVIQNGRSPWPQARTPLPLERLNQAANAIRAKAGMPQEGHTMQSSNNPEPSEEKEDKWEHIEHPYEDEPEDEKKESSIKEANLPYWFHAALVAGGVLGAGFGGAAGIGIPTNMASLWQEYRKRYGENPNMADTFVQTLKSVPGALKGEFDDGSFYDQNTQQLHDRMNGGSSTTSSASSAPVKGEMDVESKWRVVSLGEKQQPGGVGATQDNYNPHVDGPNPDGPNFLDNSQNSHEQEVALETWVNHAVDLLNQGKLEEEVIAELAKEGCPDPQSVLHRALEQNVEQPVSNEAGTDAFDMPIDQEPLGANDSVTMPQQNVTAKIAGEGDLVLIKRTNQRGRVVASFLDTWGDGILKIALESGRLVDATPGAVVALTEYDTPSDPLAAISEIINAQPADTLSTRAAVEARISNLEKATLALHDLRLAKGVSFSDQVRADSLKSEVDYELSGLRISRSKLQDSDFEYLDELPTFRINAFSVADGERPVDHTFNTRVAEDAAILVSELPDEMVADAPGVELRAFHHASAAYASDDDMTTFLAEVETRRVARLKSFGQRTASTDEANEFTPNDGPAEDLFR